MEAVKEVSFAEIQKAHVEQREEMLATLRELLSDAVADRLEFKNSGVPDSAPNIRDADRKIRVLSEIIETEA